MPLLHPHGHHGLRVAATLTDSIGPVSQSDRREERYERRDKSAGWVQAEEVTHNAFGIDLHCSVPCVLVVVGVVGVSVAFTRQHPNRSTHPTHHVDIDNVFTDHWSTGSSPS